MSSGTGIVRLFERKEKTCYLFVDNDNLFSMLKFLGDWRIDFAKFLNYLLLETDSDEIKAFFYVSKEKCESYKKKNYMSVIRELGAEIIGIPLTLKYFDDTVRSICNADIAIATDMMDYQRHFGSLVLASGDGDYKYPLEKLARKGKEIYIVSNMNSISQKFINNALFKVIDLEEVRPEIELVYD